MVGLDIEILEEENNVGKNVCEILDVDVGMFVFE